ncbi:MAG: hypothetical protein RL754_774 [Bacteroidota bacterium]
MASIKELFLSNVAQVVDNPSALVVERAEGVYLYDAENKPYLDLISGISVSNIGHCHPKVVHAVQDQVAKYMHLQVYGEFAVSPQAKLATKLLSKLNPCMGSVYFTNSGAEAIEGALKVAKRFTGRTELISFKDAYHGSTHGALSIQGSEEFKQGYYPLLPDTKILNYNKLDELKAITKRTAAVVVEAIQAEAGYIVPDPGYLLALRARTREVGALLILDEIQTGMGRTGNWFAHLDEGFCPDIMTLAKGFGGGMPLGAFVAPKHIMDVIKENPILGHITTFGGHPVSCAASLAAFEVLEENPEWMKEIPEKSAIIEAIMQHELITKVSGKGLMYCITMNDQFPVGNLISTLEDRGIITDYFLFAGNAFRITPPLSITTDELRTGLNTIIQTINDIRA